MLGRYGKSATWYRSAITDRETAGLKVTRVCLLQCFLSNCTIDIAMPEAACMVIFTPAAP